MMNIADISLIISYHMEWLNCCDVRLFLWFEKIGYFHRTWQNRTEQNKNQNNNQNKLKGWERVWDRG